MSEFRMPSLGADMQAGRLVEWRVKPGDRVARGDIVASVDTSKAEIEIEVFEDGIVGELLVKEGEEVPVGAVLATIEPLEGAAAAAPAAAPAAATTPAAAPSTAALPAAAVPAAPAPEVSAGDGHAPPHVHRPRVSPLARRVAADLGVDVDRVAGTGAGGAVTRADVEREAAERIATPPPAERAERAEAAPEPAAPARPQPAASAKAQPDRREAMRAQIAALMARSKREIPHYYLESEIDMARALAWLEAENARRSVAQRLLPATLYIKAVALATREVPELNGFWQDGGFQPGPGAHIGMAISLRGGGLVAPAIHDADAKSLDELMVALREIVKRARAGVLRASEMSDPTITVTSLGDQGVDKVFGVIYPPQVALVGFGRVIERPRAEGGMVGAHPVVAATLSADHRASDGHTGARFLAAVERLLGEPQELEEGRHG